MKTALVRLRTKTDRELAELIRRAAQRSMALAARGRFREAEAVRAQAKAWLAVAQVSEAERTRLEHLLGVRVMACA